MRRYIIATVVVLIMAPINAHAIGPSSFSIRDICCDAPEWLVKLDKNQPWWLENNLVDATIIDWKDATYTEKMATLAIFLLYREYDKLARSNNEVNLDAGYHCRNIVEIVNREVDKDSLPGDFPVWECVRQSIEVNGASDNIF